MDILVAICGRCALRDSNDVALRLVGICCVALLDCLRKRFRSRTHADQTEERDGEERQKDHDVRDGKIILLVHNAIIR